MNFQDFVEISTRYPILIRYHYQPIGNEYGKHLVQNPWKGGQPWFDMGVDLLAYKGFQNEIEIRLSDWLASIWKPSLESPCRRSSRLSTIPHGATPTARIRPRRIN